MDAGLVPLIIIAVVVLLVGPILGIIAFVRTRKLEVRSQPLVPAATETDARIIARIYALEQRLEKIEAGIGAGSESSRALPHPDISATKLPAEPYATRDSDRPVTEPQAVFGELGASASGSSAPPAGFAEKADQVPAKVAPEAEEFSGFAPAMASDAISGTAGG